MTIDHPNNRLKLFASCIAVRGQEQSLIYDFQRNDAYRITNSVYELLTFIEKRSYGEVLARYPKAQKTIKFLLENEILFLTKEPENFPALSEEWFSPEDISNAVIEVNADSKHDYQKLFFELQILHCRNILLKMNIPNPENEIEHILKIAMFHEIYFVEIWVKKNISRIKRNILIKRYPILRKILTFTSRPRKSTIIRQCIVQYSDLSSFKEYCMETHSNPIINYRFYCEAKLYNTCLNKKISIDSNGNVKNCLYLDQTFGNYKIETIKDIVASQEYMQMWHLNRDSIAKCRSCEFRYMCTDCSPFIFNRENLTFKCYRDYAVQ